jgi:ABC-type sugar transport system ATPase subunit
MQKSKNILEIKNISKYFPGIVALENVNFEVKKGTIHCIVGENGAGKSTLIKILTGAEKRSSGEITFNGSDYNPRTVGEAIKSGMSALFQELNIIEQLTVEQNLTLGVEKKKFGIILEIDENDRVFKILKTLDENISRKQRVSELSFVEKQIVEMARSLSQHSKIIIMDEPSASLSEKEVEKLFNIILELKKQGITIIYITHKLDEVFKIGDYITVIRDGNVIGTREISKISSKSEVIKMMLGKDVSEDYSASNINYDNKILKVKNVDTSELSDISFEVYQGEILGFFGLRGSGKTEITQALLGLDVLKSGSITIDDRNVHIKIPKDAIECGISLVTEERITAGLILKLSIRDNISLTNYKKVSKLGIVNSHKEKLNANDHIKLLKIISRSSEQSVKTLSGGNQQKVVIAKCINADAKILLMDEPTRGIDIGSKKEIHDIIRNLSSRGVTAIIFSSELTEIKNLCDRVFILHEGKILKEFKNNEINDEQIMHLIM